MGREETGSFGGTWKRLATGNVLWLSVASFLNDASSEMIFPLLPLFLVGSLGASPAFLGVVEGLAESTAAFVKLGGGWLSDRLRKRRPLVAGGYGLAALTRPVLAIATAPWHVLVIRFTDRVGKGVRTAPRDALLADSLDRNLRGRAFGLHRAADHAGAVVGPILAAGLLLLWPGRLRLVFLLAVIPAALAALVVLRRVSEISPPTGPRVSTWAGAVTAEPAAGARVLRRPFAGYLAVLVLFTLGNASDAFLLLRARELGVAVALIPILWGALHVSKMAWNLVGGTLADRVGVTRTLIAGWVVYAITYAGFAAAGSAWQAWVLFVVYGIFYGFTEPTEKVLVASLAPAAARARAFGAYHFAIGIAALPASIIFGVLWDARGPATAFYLGAGLALLAAVLLPFVLAEESRPAARR